MHIASNAPTNAPTAPTPNPPASSPSTYPAYYLGRPVAVYQRRYRRRAPASRQLT